MWTLDGVDVITSVALVKPGVTSPRDPALQPKAWNLDEGQSRPPEEKVSEVKTSMKTDVHESRPSPDDVDQQQRNGAVSRGSEAFWEKLRAFSPEVKNHDQWEVETKELERREERRRSEEDPRGGTGSDAVSTEIVGESVDLKDQGEAGFMDWETQKRRTASWVAEHKRQTGYDADSEDQLTQHAYTHTRTNIKSSTHVQPKTKQPKVPDSAQDGQSNARTPLGRGRGRGRGRSRPQPEVKGVLQKQARTVPSTRKSLGNAGSNLGAQKAPVQTNLRPKAVVARRPFHPGTKAESVSHPSSIQSRKPEKRAGHARPVQGKSSAQPVGQRKPSAAQSAHGPKEFHDAPRKSTSQKKSFSQPNFNEGRMSVVVTSVKMKEEPHSDPPARSTIGRLEVKRTRGRNQSESAKSELSSASARRSRSVSAIVVAWVFGVRSCEVSVEFPSSSAFFSGSVAVFCSLHHSILSIVHFGSDAFSSSTM